ncbi:metal-dependent hydrolase [Ramlibacter rhizophilus]|uniref:Metal-dependent hydrolase n=1 Tax=Ramlibacter rhizophilus TaxID=1781167 RepID=A0A4Z0C2L6_9BURK|nr:metal-dependent hydrolase [Ramlibacter rhizophilus]TFZ04710.1 metal-dependent hydrolase [Ramlibacter rhizophilus]
MTALAVRRLLIDLDAPIARHWCAGDAFRTALFNALSMSFPVGEQFFIDAVRDGFEALPAALKPRFAEEVRGFVGQEATHRRVHGLFNAHLERQGLRNTWGPRAAERQKLLKGEDLRHRLAVTAAYEHFTAILADWLLHHPEVLGTEDARLATLWLWHSAEESEHKSTAFDLYQALDGNHAWRLKWFRRVTIMFVGDTLRQTVRNLHHDGTLWRWSTWRSAAAHLFGRSGLVIETLDPWRAYRRADFHPRQLDTDLAERWLRENAGQFRIV